MNIDSAIGLLFRITADDAQSARVLSELEKKSDKTTAKVASDFSRMGASIGSALSSIGSKVAGFGATLSVAVTAPLVAAGYSIGKFGLDVQALRNQMTAFEGSSEAAESRLAALRSLVDSTSGATREMAYSIYGMLRPLNASDESINRTIETIARLKLGFKNLVPEDFTYNLTQIFGQGFEESDIKQAIGQVPKFREYLLKAFGTSDNAALKQMKESGQLTMESFLAGFADAVANDSALAGLAEPTALRMQKFFEKSFEAIEPLANRIVEIIAQLITLATPYLEQFAAWFKTLSPLFQNIIIAVGAIAAALGPVLAILGSALAVIGSIVSGVVAVGGLVVIAKAVGIALLAVVGLLIQIGPVLLAAGAAAVALYKAWETNFGGIRDFTLEAFAVIKENISSALAFIYDTVRGVGGAMVAWWRENYPLIRQTVETVSNAIRETVGALLAALQNFWTEHGERIKTYTAGVWDTIKQVVSSAIELVSAAVRLTMQVISGDWEGAWNSLLRIVETATEHLVSVWQSAIRNFTNLLKALIPVINDYFLKFLTLSSEWSLRIIAAVLAIWATLPLRLIELVPKFFAALRDIGAAIWRGLREGYNREAENQPLFVPPPVPVEGVDSVPTEGGDTPSSAIPDASLLEKQRKAREEALKKQLADLSRYNQLQIEAERQKFEDINRAQQAALEDGEITYSVYQEQMIRNTEAFQQRIINLMRTGFELSSRGKTGQELENERQQYLNDLAKFSSEMNRHREDIAKRAVETEKKQNETKLKNTQDSIQKEVALREKASATVLARYERDAAEGLLTEEKLIQSRQRLELDLLNFKKEKLNEELKAVKGNAEEEKRIRHELALLGEEISTAEFQHARETTEFVKKSLEEQKQLARELSSLKLEVLEEERRLEEFRADQDRKRLENTLEFARGRARLQALIELRNFEEREAQRRRDRQLAELEAEKRDELERIKGKENEEEQKFQIEELYRQRRLLAEEEFQARLKEIRDQMNPAIETEENLPGGFFGRIFGSLASGIADYLKNVALVEDANGRLKFSFEQLFTTVADMGLQAFAQLAAGFGQMVANWVLYGNQGGQGFRKMVAQVLANVAQMATTYAIMCLAAAALASTVWGAAILGGTPGQFLAAAALFGAVAAGTALAGRAIAGDSFNNSAAKSSFGAASSAGAGTGRGSGGGGTQFSSHGSDRTVIDESRIRQESLQKVELVIRSNDSHIVDVVERNVSDRGPLHNLIVKIAEG